MPMAWPAARERSGSEDRTEATTSKLSSSRAAVRWTSPMNDPGPPPMTPRRSRRPSFGIALFRDIDSLSGQHPRIERTVDITAGEDQRHPLAGHALAFLKEGGERRGAGALDDIVRVGEVVAHGRLDRVLA